MKEKFLQTTSRAALTRPPLPSRNENPSVEEATSSPISEGDDDPGAHVDGIDFGADDIGQDELGQPGAAVPGGLIDREMFWMNFRGLFALGGVVSLPPFPLESLPIRPDEEQAARAASDSLYDIALETPFLQWLLSPESEWAKRIITILAFVGPKAMAVKAEIVAKAEAEARPMKDVTPKADNADAGDGNLRPDEGADWGE